MQRLEVSGAVRPIYVSLGVKRLMKEIESASLVSFYVNYFERNCALLH